LFGRNNLPFQNKFSCEEQIALTNLHVCRIRTEGSLQLDRSGRLIHRESLGDFEPAPFRKCVRFEHHRVNSRRFGKYKVIPSGNDGRPEDQKTVLHKLRVGVGSEFEAVVQFTTFLTSADFIPIWMRERAALLGGSLAVRGAPGKGVCVTLELPRQPAQVTMNGKDSGNAH